MGSVRIATLALAAVLGSSLVIGEASAMPVDRLASATNQIADGAQDVRWGCGPYRCGWRPSPYWRATTDGVGIAAGGAPVPIGPVRTGGRATTGGVGIAVGGDRGAGGDDTHQEL